jgi:hypothetical protein
MRGIATALDVDPTAFAEYRLASAQAQLNEQSVGLREALARPALVEAVLSGQVPGEGAR